MHNESKNYNYLLFEFLVQKYGQAKDLFKFNLKPNNQL